MNAPRFTNKKGHGIHGTEVVFPILGCNPPQPWKVIGTGFFILRDGIFATAKHVLIDDQNHVWSEENLAIIQFVTPDHIKLRDVRHVFVHPLADVAVGVLRPPHDGCALCNKHKVMGITRSRPLQGSEVDTYAFPLTRIGPAQLEANLEIVPPAINPEDGNPARPKIQEVNVRATNHSGNLVSFHAEGLGVVRGPCYRTTVQTLGGASGGPVFAHSAEMNAAFAINSSSWEGENDSTASGIESILDMVLTNIRLVDGSVVAETVENLMSISGIEIG